MRNRPSLSRLAANRSYSRWPGRSVKPRACSIVAGRLRRQSTITPGAAFERDPADHRTALATNSNLHRLAGLDVDGLLPAAHVLRAAVAELGDDHARDFTRAGNHAIEDETALGVGGRVRAVECVHTFLDGPVIHPTDADELIRCRFPSHEGLALDQAPGF